LGDPDPALVTTPVVALLVTAPATTDGVAEGLPCRYSAATPAACGVAIDVPLSVAVAVFEVCQAERTLEPGAKTSRHEP
jgi:hypothetical protein